MDQIIIPLPWNVCFNRYDVDQQCVRVIAIFFDVGGSLECVGQREKLLKNLTENKILLIKNVNEIYHYYKNYILYLSVVTIFYMKRFFFFFAGTKEELITLFVALLTSFQIAFIAYKDLIFFFFFKKKKNSMTQKSTRSKG